MLGKFLASLAIGVLILVVYLYFYLGFSRPVEFTVGDRGPFVMIYKSHNGAYHQIGPVIQAVEQWATQNGIRCELTFGEYLDDPAAIEQDRLRSRGGCLFTAAPGLPLPQDFILENRPVGHYLIGRFEGAPSIGPFKVYPKAQDYIQNHRLKQNGAVVETYSIRGEKVTTEFLFPLEKMSP